MNLPRISVWRDYLDRSAARQMALDEAIFRLKPIGEAENQAFLRFYAWEKPARTIGFFMPCEEMVSRTYPIDSENLPYCFVRRLTGGGIVEHGEDVTFSIAAGKNHPLSAESTTERYRLIHEALRDALVESEMWPAAELAPISTNAETDRAELACFSNPVGWDVIDQTSGEKIAGGAQRSSRGAWLHQGTVQIRGEISISADWTTLFAEKLGAITNWTGDSEIENAAADLENERYATLEWNERVTKPTSPHRPKEPAP